MGGRIKVLVVDDSMVFRTAVSKGLEGPEMHVIGTACTAREAWGKILDEKPDVITLDVEMPGMSGLEFLRKFIPIVYIPTVVVSAANIAVFDALNAGAVDFVAKPSQTASSASFVDELRGKVKIAANARRSPVSMAARPRQAAAPDSQSARSTARQTGVIMRPDITVTTHTELIAIGASTGGTEATSAILRNLPSNLPGIVITQHMPPVFTKLYAERLDRECSMRVKEAANGDVVEKGWAYIAPGDMHMRVVKRSGKLVITCEAGPKVSGHCPSVDVLFESVAKACGSNAVGIILTGMGADGARGLTLMKRSGAFTIGQDQKSCVVYGMPMEAYKMGAVTKQSALENIPAVLVSYLKTGMK